MTGTVVAVATPAVVYAPAVIDALETYYLVESSSANM
jgi:hypothetical protein